MIKKQETLYMDQKGVDKLNAEIEELRAKLVAIRNFNSMDLTDRYNTVIAEINREEATLVNALNTRLNELARVQLIQKQDSINTEDIIDLDDTISVDFMESGKVNDSMVFKLVGGNGDLSKEISEISVNSPLGKAVYQKHVGDTCSYDVEKNKITLVIVSKLDLTQSEDLLQR